MPGKGAVVLTPTDHLATGGEGAVYLKNGLVFKIFLDANKAKANGMLEKIALLSQLRHPFLVAPKDVLLDDKHNVIGYYMDEAKGAPLMKIFTNSWRDVNAFSNVQSIELVENMREAVTQAHAFGAIMVDANETNYLAHGVQPRVIDVDSWQIGRHKATAIMPSIRDFHAKVFDTNSDWFSWAVVSFQVFTGVHPYKGTHPDFKKGDMQARMQANASVFDKRVRLNSAVRDFSLIPAPLLDWYERVLQQGERSTPPSALQSQSPKKLTKKMRMVVGSSGLVKHEHIRSFAGAIRHVGANGVAYVRMGEDLHAFDLVRQQAITQMSTADIERLFANDAILVRQGDAFMYIWTSGTHLQGRLVFGEKDPRHLQPSLTNLLPLAAQGLVVVGDRFFALNKHSDNGLVELTLVPMGQNIVLAIKSAWPINVQSTQFFDGCAVMDCLGAPFLVVPQGDALVMLPARTLTGLKLINGYTRGPSMVWIHGISRQDGLIYRMELRSDGKEFQLLKSSVVDAPILNVTVNARGVAVSIFEDGMVTAQSTTGSTQKQVPDANVTLEMKLFTMSDGVFYTTAKDVFRLSLSTAP